MTQNMKGTDGFGPIGPRHHSTPSGGVHRHDATDGNDMAITKGGAR